MSTNEVGVNCERSLSGGKGNRGKFIDRDTHICAAGVPTAQPYYNLQSSLQHYLLKDEVDALINDALIPDPPPKQLPPLRYPPKPDQRYCGLNSELANLVNPPEETKFQAFINELKDTSYKSYWKAPLGTVPDASPMFPGGYDIKNTTFGDKLPHSETLYDVVMPKNPLPDRTRPSELPGAQKCRNYCKPFDPDLTYGYRTNADDRGIFAKCNLTDERVVQGTANVTMMSFIQADSQHKRQPPLGRSLKTCNVNCVSSNRIGEPESVLEVISTFSRNPKVSVFRNCIAYLHKLRNHLRKQFSPTFFIQFYRGLKYLDKLKSGWISKDILYNYCNSNMIKIDPSLIEPLLCLWEAFDGMNIEYRTFVDVINFRQAIPDLPKIPDYHPDCLDFRTTYGEMVKTGQESDNRRKAGLPSGYTREVDLPHETDINACLRPSVMTLTHASFRDVYARREPQIVRKVFEAIGEKFSGERFDRVWEEAKKYHSQGWVCFETFRKALQLFPQS